MPCRCVVLLNNMFCLYFFFFVMIQHMFVFIDRVISSDFNPNKRHSLNIYIYLINTKNVCRFQINIFMVINYVFIHFYEY